MTVKREDDMFVFDKVMVDSITDGDTIKVTIDLGFNIKHSHTIRFLDFDAPEVKLYAGVTAAHKKRGLEVREWLKNRIEGSYVTLKTKKYDGDKEKYGRYLGLIYLDGICINHEMVKLGFNKTDKEKEKETLDKQ